MFSDQGREASHRVWVTFAAAALTLTGCGGAGPAPVENAGLDSRYVSVADGDVCTTLLLQSDGRLIVREEERGDGRDRKMRPEPTPLASGTWDFSDGRLALEGDGWTAAFTPDSTRVEVPRRAGTLSSLRWVTSSEGSPFSACDLVSASELDNLIDPPEGSGSSGW